VDDAIAIQRLKNGDISGLKALVERYELKALRSAYLISQDNAIAEDSVQSAFLRAAKAINHFDSRRPFQPWFMRIVVNETLKRVNQRKRFVYIESEENDPLDYIPDDSQSPEAIVDSHEAEAAVQMALQELSPDHRAVIVLRYYLGYSESEIAHELNKPLGTIRSRLFHAQQRLRGLLLPLLGRNGESFGERHE
jgi:RNA polymerase sigma-70 factor, ECF subfamily